MIRPENGGLWPYVYDRKQGRKRMQNGKKITFFIFEIPAVLCYGIFFVFPLILGIYYSFTDWNGIDKSFHYVGPENYIKILSDRKAYSSILFTIKYALLLSFIITLLALILGILLNQKLKGLKFLKTIYFFPAVMSPIIIGLIFNEIYYRALPAIGKAAGIELLSKSLISSPATAMWAIIIANVWQAVAIPTVIVIAGLQAISPELYEVASIDGAGWWKKFSVITLPFLAPTLGIVLVLAVKDGFLVFDYILAITGGGPAGSTHSIGTFIYQTAFENYNYSYAVANSVILFVMIAVFGFLQIQVTRKMEAREN